MKRFLLIILSIIMTLSVISCTKIEFEYDLDLTKEDNLYGTLEDYIKNPDKCKGRHVKISAETTVVYNFSENKIARHSIVAYDKNSDMRALYEIRSNDGKYPKTGTAAELGGIFTDGYIDVKEYFNADFSSSSFDIDALSMTADELQKYLQGFNEQCNAHKDFGKMIRIYGNINVFKNDKTNYFYLNGFNASGSRTWSVELTTKDQSIKLPETNSKHVNTYEIIGTIDMYMENYIAYPCIRVSEIRAVEGILKAEEADVQQPIITPGQ